MIHKINSLINNGEWEAAKELIEQIEESDVNEVVCIYAATIYMNLQQFEKSFSYIKKGLEYNYRNYELYLLLGNYYEQTNIFQAAICYENALFYCTNDDDALIIKQFSDRLDFDIPKTSFIILSYNSILYTKECIESIRLNNRKESYEIIVVDNASEDDSVNWLKTQDDIKLICNSQNMGFPYACNQGIKISDPDADIMLLNNDTLVTPNAIFWLKMGLYSEPKVGATGSVSNRVSNDQRVDIGDDNIDSLIKYAIKNNVPMENPLEEKIFLVGFAMLIRREALDEIGLLDIRFSPGTYEDNDYGVRLHNAGWHVYLCHNSFIYHYGGNGGKNREVWRNLVKKNSEQFEDKWGVDLRYYAYPKTELLNFIHHSKNEKFKVLEVGCGFGATLNKIKYIWPKSEIYGIENIKKITSITEKYTNIINGDAEVMQIPYKENMFDYIMFAGALEHFKEPEETIKRFMPYLKKDGQILCSVNNIMHTSIIIPLLKKGILNCNDAEIFEYDNLRLFTLRKVYKLLSSESFELLDMGGVFLQNNEEQAVIEKINNILELADLQQFNVYKYIFKAKRKYS